MKKPLFVFAGQSNMLGAPVYEATEQIYYKNSAEYMHKRRRFGQRYGEFKTYAFPTGEFSYKSLDEAYGENRNADMKSTLNDHGRHVFFGASMSNLLSDEEKKVYPFAHFSEDNNRKAPSMAPYIVQGLEDKGYSCLYTHIAKGGVAIKHFLEGGAAEYFNEKVADFFSEAKEKYPDDDISEKILVCHQGESDKANGYDCYKEALYKLWENAKNLGFTKFFMVRVGYFGTDSITDVMKAQEDFCNECNEAYMITRVASFIPWKGKNDADWFIDQTSEEFTFCRDSFHGFANGHINEKGFKVIAKYAVPNIIRILYENKQPVVEKERIIGLI